MRHPNSPAPKAQTTRRPNRIIVLNVPESFRSVYPARMGHPTTEQLTTMALSALEESAALCRHKVQPQSRGIAVALAFLAYVSRSTDRHFFDRFWRALRTECQVQRSAEASAALNAIYEAVGRRREIEVMSAFERAARETYGAPPGYPL